MKKDLKEAILGIEVIQFDGQKADLEELVNPKQLEKIISDWIPEVLSQEWIDSNSINASSDGVTEEYVHVDDLENLIIPKQELPVIPKSVAEYLDFAKKEASLIQVMETTSVIGGWTTMKKEFDWISANDEVFARAWLDGYEVEKEKLYYIKFSENQYAQRFDGTKIDSILVNDKSIAAKFTKEEIKKMNANFMALAVEETE